MSDWPSVQVLIPTHHRPELLAEAIASVRAQDYPGPLSVLVIFDRQEPDAGVPSDGPVPVVTTTNTRTPGLAGARNTGILTSTAQYVAFCDDDDVWLPGKLRKQVQRILDEPGLPFVTTGIRVDFADQHSPRLAGTDTVTHEQLLRSRMSMLHSSTFLIRRESLVGELGLVDEDAPGSQNEDWELLLRASGAHPIAHVDEPLVAVRWGATSLFARAWESKIASTLWILDRYPRIRDSSAGHARVLGQIAFAYAALGRRRQALRWCRRAVRSRPGEPRAYLAAAVAVGVLSPQRVLALLHRHGRGV